jgi:hypothetical protein
MPAGVAVTRIAALAGLLLAAPLLTGCASAERAEVESTAERFAEAVGSGDAGTACSLLSDDAADHVTSPEHPDCADAVASLRMAPGRVSGAEVWGDRAQVRLTSDVLFLVRLQDGWRISAAGCVPRGERPHDCEIDS